MPVFNNVLAGAAGQSGGDAGYKIERSLRFNASDQGYLNRTPSSAGNRRTWTLSVWCKKTSNGSYIPLINANNSTNPYLNLSFTNSDQIRWLDGSNQGQALTNASFRDNSAWYHIVCAVDTTLSTATDRVKIYVNGVRQDLTFPTTVTQNHQTQVNNNTEHRIGRWLGNSNNYLNAYLADYYLIDGQALAPTEFGGFDEDTGVWNPIEYTNTTTTTTPATVTPTLSNGAIIIKGVGGVQASGTITSSGGNLNFFASGNGINWTHVGTGTSHTYGGGDWLAAGGAGGSPRTFTTSGPDFKFAAWNTDTNFDQSSGHTTDVTGLTLSDAPTSNYGGNGFYLDFSDNSSNAALGTDSSGNNNTWTVNNLQATANNNTLSSHSHTGHPAGEPTSKFLDGSSSTYYSVVATSSNSTTTAEFTFGTSLSGTLEVLYQNGNSQVTGRISIDGGANYTALGTYSSPTWINVGTINGNNVRLRATFNTGGGSTAYFYGIRVNGVNVVTDGAESAIDTLIDTPTNYEASSGNNGGNYCTMSPIDHHGCTFSNGNLDITAGSSKCGRGTFWANSGKWYFEFDITTYGNPYVGIASRGTLQHYVSGNSIAINNGGNVYVSTNGSQTYPGKSVRLNAIGSYMCAFDLDNGKIWWGKDGTWYERTNAHANMTTTLSEVEAGNGATEFSSHTSFGDYWTVQFGTSTNTSAYSLNAGQRPFKYPNSVPSGFKSLCTQNLTDPEILDGSAHFASSLYTGSSALTKVGGPVFSASADSGVTNAGYIFNGDSNNGGYYNGTGTNTVLTTSPFTINTQLRVYNNFRSDGTYAICLNDSCVNVAGSGTSSAAYRWSTVDLSSFSLPLDVTKLGYSNSQNSGNTIKLIEVDGTVLVDGQGTSTKFKPDLAWLKSIGTGRYHFWHDSVRGSTKALYSNRPDVEYDYGTSGVTSFNDDGITINGGYAANYTNETYVAWLWNGGNLATNSAYNQSETWSNGVTSSAGAWPGGFNTACGPVTNGFNGDTGNGVCATGGANIVWNNPQSTSTLSGTLEFYNRSDTTTYSRTAIITHAGGTTSAITLTPNSAWQNLGTYTGITAITITGSNPGGGVIDAIKVGGKILVDPGFVPVGALNDTIYNTTSNWSVPGSNMQNNWSASFDGDTDPHFALPNTGYSASMTFPSAISYQTLELVVCRDIYAPDLLMNGNALNVPATDTNTTSGRYKIERLYFTNGTLTSIGHETRNTAGRGGSGFWQIIVDGKILVDANQASNAPNVPSITTTCISNPAAGFAISTYKGNSTDGASIATNLGSTPEMVIVKARDKSDDWRVYHVGAGNPYYLRLQLGNAGRSGTNNWREMSLNYFALDADSAVNSSSYDYVAYSFSSTPGFSRFGSYTGSGDQQFIPLGFRPAWVMIKRYTDNTVGEWTIYDSARAPSNEIQKKLWANSDSTQEDHPNNSIDFVSNGFVVDPGSNAPNVQYTNNGNVGYLFAAFAENPFKIARAR